MKKKNKTDVLELLSTFQKSILKDKPSVEQMYDDIRMMKFKIRSLHGDVSTINMDNTNFIEALWSLGKVDEFFQNHIERLSPSQRDLFFPLLDEMYTKFQKELNGVGQGISQKERSADSPSNFEMEIFKERSRKLN